MKTKKSQRTAGHFGVKYWWERRKTPRYSRNYLQLFGTVLFCIGIGFGITFGGYKLFKEIFALSESTKILPTQQSFNAAGYADGAGAMNVMSTEVRLATSSAWWNGNWNYKKQLTLKNLSGNIATAGATMKVTIDTKALYDANHLLASGDDLRVVYSTASAYFKELVRSTTPADGTTIQTSTATEIAFPLQADIANSGTDTNYYLYYGNSQAPAYFTSALSFDGSNDLVTVPSSSGIRPTTAMTVEVWVNASDITSGKMILRLEDPENSNNGYYLRINGGGFQGLIGSGSGWKSVSGGTVNVGKWNHIAMTFDGSNQKLYINGTLVATTPYSGSISYTGSGSLIIGNGASAWSGNVSEVRIWNTARTQDQIRKYIGGSFMPDATEKSQLAGLWHMTEGSGQTITDSSGNGNNGTLGANASVGSDDPTWTTSGLLPQNAMSFDTAGGPGLMFHAPFRGTTTATGGQTPTTATGAIRYSGSKSAMSFSGAGNSITVAPNASINNLAQNAFTAEAWVYVKQNDPFGGYQTIIRKSKGGGLIGFYFYFYNRRLNGTIYPTDSIGDAQGASANANFPTGQWVHIAITYDNNGDRKAHLFQNGAEVTYSQQNTVSKSMGDDNAASTTIGDFYGNIDELRISNVVRYSSSFTPSTSAFKPDSNTKLLYHFDENGDDPRLTGKVFDVSGNGNHGTITGAKYVSGLIGVDAGTTDTGYQPYQSYGGHGGVFIEEGTTNLVTNPSFENSTYNTNWGANYMNYATASATFTPNVAKRNSAGPFAAGVMAQGDYNNDSSHQYDLVSAPLGTAINNYFFPNNDTSQGSIIFWVTPEWNGNDGRYHSFYWDGYMEVSKSTDNKLYIMRNGSGILSQDISTWISGTTYLVIARWDSKNTLDGTNYASLTINNTTVFGATTISGAWNNNSLNKIQIGSRPYYSNPVDWPANAIVEGLTVYRRPIFDGTRGSNVGNGDELTAIYNSGTGKDPTLVTGSWDVVFALPTNAATGSLTTGTGNAWSHPHSSNLLYTSTTKTGGFMMNGTYSADGWTLIGSPTVAALTSSNKIFQGGYSVQSNDVNQGIGITFGATTNGSYVLRALGNSDGTCNPVVKVYRADGTTLMTSLAGTTTSLKNTPDNYIFTWQSPNTENEWVELINTASSGTCSWHQVELLSNLITNPSMEGGSGDPWIPTGWVNNQNSLVASESFAITGRSGVNAWRHARNSTGGCCADLYQDNTLTAARYYALDFWYKGDVNSRVTNGYSSGLTHQYLASRPDGLWDGLSSNKSSWGHFTGAFRAGNTSGRITFGSYANTGSVSIDDVGLFALNDVSLTVTPANQANATEATGLRVGGNSTLTQTISGLSATSGVAKFKFTPRHNTAVSQSFGSGAPFIFLGWANGTNFFDIQSGQIVGNFNGTQISSPWSYPGGLVAGTTYEFEISYTSGAALILKINGTQVGSVSGVVPFSVAPNLAYFGTDNNNINQVDGTFTSFVSLTPSSNTTAPYYKFGATSAKLTGTMDYPDQYTTAVTLPSNGAYTVSAYVYNGTSGAIGGTVDNTVAQLASGSAALTTTYTDMGGGWWRLSNSSGVMPTQTINYGVQLAAGKTAYVDGVQVENLAYATTYTDGSLGSGYAWTSTANASSSTRTAGSLIFSNSNNFNPNQGAISIWYKPKQSWDTTYDGSGRALLTAGGQNVIQLSQNSNVSYISMFGGLYLHTAPSQESWRHTVVTYSSTQSCIYSNGSLIGCVGGAALNNGTNLQIGPIAGVISDLRIFNSPLTLTQVKSLYNESLSTHSEGTEGIDKYVSSGTYTSPSIDLGANGAWGMVPISLTNYIGGGSINYSTRTSADGNSWSAWAPVVGSAIASNPLRYLQIQAAMTAKSDQSDTPVWSGATIAYVQDTTPPVNPSNTALGYVNSASSSATLVSGTWYNYATPKFSWDAANDVAANGQAASGVASYLALLTTDNTASPSANTGDNCFKQTTDSDRTFTVGSSPSTCSLSSDGTYYLRVQSKDNSGNVADPVTLFTYKYDGSRPNAPVSVSTTNLGYQATNTFTFFWPSATDNGPSGVLGYEYKTATTSGSFASWQFTSATSVAGVPAYTQGQNFFYVRTKDTAGNYSGETSNNVAGASFYYNQSAPTAPLNLKVTPDTTSASPASSNVFSASWDKPANYSGEIAKYYYCVNCTPSILTMTETTAAETVNRALTNVALATQQGKNTLYLVAEDNNVNATTGKGNVNFDAAASVDFYASTIAPGSPTNLTISDASDRTNSKWRLTLAWDAPTTGGTPTKYEINRSLDNLTFSKVGEVTSTAYTDTGLTQSTAYYYKVRAVDNAGSTSLYSNTVTKAAEGKYVTPPTTGGTPSVTTGSTTATIKWTTGRKAIGTVEYGKTTGYGSASSETDSATDHSLKVSGLAPGTEYHYRVQSIDDGELVGYDKKDAYSIDYSFTTLNTAAISDIKVTDITLSSAIITWNTSSLASTQIEYGESTDYGTKLDDSGAASESAHTVKLSNLKHSTTYHFRVRGTTSDGDDIYSQDNQFDTLKFPKVTALIFNTDQSAGATTAVIAWVTNVETTAEVQYQALSLDPSIAANYSLAELQKLSQTDLARVPVVAKGDAKTQYTGKYDSKHVERIEGLSDGAIYVFTVRGRDRYGNEVVGEPVRYVTAADTRPPEIKNVVIETPTQGVGADTKAQIIVSWDTDEPAIGQIVWGQGTGSEYPQATEKDGALTTKHVFVIRDLQPTTSYHLKIVATDKSGNKADSKDTVVVTPTAEQAAFDIIIKNLEDVFGFLKL